MPKIKTAKTFKRLSFLRQFLFVAAPVALVMVAHELFPSRNIGSIIFGLLFAGFVICAVYIIRNGHRFSWPEFVCPECKVWIEHPLETTEVGGEPILYFCTKCDVLWHTGNTERD